MRHGHDSHAPDVTSSGMVHHERNLQPDRIPLYLLPSRHGKAQCNTAIADFRAQVVRKHKCGSVRTLTFVGQLRLCIALGRSQSQDVVFSHEWKRKRTTAVRAVLRLGTILLTSHCRTNMRENRATKALQLPRPSSFFKQSQFHQSHTNGSQ